MVLGFLMVVDQTWQNGKITLSLRFAIFRCTLRGENKSANHNSFMLSDHLITDERKDQGASLVCDDNTRGNLATAHFLSPGIVRQTKA
jgi:hypothetical protein